MGREQSKRNVMVALSIVLLVILLCVCLVMLMGQLSTSP